MLALEKVFVGELKKQYSKGEIAGKIRGRKSGYIEGELAGIKLGKREIVKNLFKMGMSVGEIAQASGLEVEEIEKIIIENGA